MTTFSPPPVPQGTSQQQLVTVYSYLFQMADQLNLALTSLDSGNFQIGSDAQKIVSGGVSGKTSAELSSQASALKSLIIKTSDTVRSEIDKLSATLTGSYVAQSDFGSYVQKLSAQIEADPSSITQYYKFAADLQSDISTVDTNFTSYKTETEAYIKTGIVYYVDEGATPVYGVAVGQGITSTEVDGETVVEQKQFRSTFTANRLSFWQDQYEVAYLSNNKLYIKEATIETQLNIGNWVVSQDHGLTFKWGG